MADPAKPTDPAPTEYTQADALLFQAWLVFFLVIVCFALVNYLVSYLPR